MISTRAAYPDYKHTNAYQFTTYFYFGQYTCEN